MYVTVIATKDRDDGLADNLPEGTLATSIDLSDGPEKAIFIGRFTGVGTALYRTLEKIKAAG